MIASSSHTPVRVPKDKNIVSQNQNTAIFLFSLLSLHFEKALNENRREKNEKRKAPNKKRSDKRNVFSFGGRWGTLSQAALPPLEG